MAWAYNVGLLITTAMIKLAMCVAMQKGVQT